MTTLNTGLPIDHQIPSKLTPALRISIQKATSTFQKDFCYDFLQAIVEEPEISDTLGIRLFLNFCLKKPETLIESWQDSIDQTLDSNDLYNSSDSILCEIDNFLDFIDGFIQIINTTELFKLAYHEIDAWNLCFKLLDSIQRKLYELASLDLSNLKSDPNHQLTIASDSSSSSFYQAFMSFDKYLKHTFDSRVLLEPAKLVDHLSDLNERQIELKAYRTRFPTIQSSTVLTKKFGRFGREELAIDQFLESDKFKDLIKKKNSVGGAQLTRQPSTRVRKSTTQTDPPIIPTKSKPKRSTSTLEPESNPKRKSQVHRSTSHSTKPNSPQPDTGAHIDPYLLDVETSPILGKLAFADAPRSSPSSNPSPIQSPKPKPTQPKPPNESTKKTSSSSTTTTTTTTTSSSLSKLTRKRKPNQEDSKKHGSNRHSNSSDSNKKRKSKGFVEEEIKHQDKKISIQDEDDEDDDGDGDGDGDDDGVFVIEKIIGERLDEEGQVVYKVLWAGYPESEATWQAFNTLEDCAAIDVWEEEKKSNAQLVKKNLKKIVEDSDADVDADGEVDEELVGNRGKSPAAIV
ncbi:uncharacterized protein MELLADRAFT_68185 [Melampsora larici-populina 98AG31]|uniref:Chromo domain-containing protein n=1 Tax=Melampsora larici-populina (strain 98AG31 / pathotype 3-4-7) TaxID=747676 RepID=F4S5V9_MELLP|nr:uncharacterized protein MELLADRAFT_68185 [Melampsora larici-populina 98AG31]EGF99997.1 hypothetical protein MELLADRAFT_68185 [Melampsora larici-populina 98AG31]